MNALARLLTATLLSPALIGAAHSAPNPPAQPNILIILADDLGWADVSCNGSREMATPHIDSIAANGVRCTAGYVTAPQCSPSRAGLLTGRYQQRFGHENNNHISCLNTGQKLLPAYLKPAGYDTGMVGKWHLGMGTERHPMQHGFDEFYGFQGGGHAYLGEREADKRTPVLRGTRVEKPGDFLTTRFGHEAARFISDHPKKPWFLYLAFNAPHVPLTMPPGYEARVAPIASKNRALCVAMMLNEDDAVGDVLDALRKTGQEERTLVVFLSDNGGTAIPPEYIKNASINLPFRGVKGDVYEGGIREPFMMQWKGVLPAGRIYEQPVSSLDLLPTALAAAGLPVPATAPLDGVNLLPFLDGTIAGSPHAVLYWRFQNVWAVRKGDWKWVAKRHKPDELYDLATDPAESKDLSARHPEVAKQLAGLWEKWNASNPPLGPAVKDGSD